MYITGHFEFKSNHASYFHLYWILQMLDDLLKSFPFANKNTLKIISDSKIGVVKVEIIYQGQSRALYTVKYILSILLNWEAEE